MSVTSNNYIKKLNDNYEIDVSIAALSTASTNNNNIIIDKDSISLTDNSSNYYFHKLSIGHCSEQWQDWFCIPNFHNNNKYSMYPNTNNMDIGACFKYCDSQGDAKDDNIYTPNNTKCTLYEDDNDIIYNPLAIIAIIGTHFNIKYDSNYTIENLRKTLQVYDEYAATRSASKKVPLWKVGENLRLVPTAMTSNKLMAEENFLRRNVMAATVKRYLKNAEKIISGTSLGRFPVSTKVV